MKKQHAGWRSTTRRDRPLTAAASRAMGSHQSTAMLTDRWLTPRFILDALGEFDLDPCGAPDWPTATTIYTPETHGDGLSLDWEGRVWLNPPYGAQAALWMQRLADHGRGTALIFARTETRMFFDTVWRRADAVLFLEGRLTFLRPDGSPAKGNGGGSICSRRIRRQRRRPARPMWPAWLPRTTRQLTDERNPVTTPLPMTAMVYVIHWPALGILKVGRAWKMSRIRHLTDTGGVVILLMRDRPLAEETAALRAMGERYDRTFQSEQDSVTVLPRGRGFTECFNVRSHELAAAIRTIFRGIALYGNEQTADAADGSIQRGSADVAVAGSEVDGGRAAVERRRPRARVGEPVAGEGGDMAVEPGNDRRSDRGLHAAPRRPRVHRDLQRRRADLLRHERVARGESPTAIPHPDTPTRHVPAAFQRPASGLLGWGERGRERGRRERGREPSGVRWNPSIPVLQVPPTVRHTPQLSPLRDRPTGARPMDSRAQRQLRLASRPRQLLERRT